MQDKLGRWILGELRKVLWLLKLITEQVGLGLGSGTHLAAPRRRGGGIIGHKYETRTRGGNGRRRCMLQK